MNPAWVRALILVCVFAAAVLLAELVVRRFVVSHADSKAINLRLRMIGRGKSRGEAMNLLRRGASGVPVGLPAPLDDFARRLEHTLAQAQTTFKTSTLMLIILIAPVAIFFAMLLFMAMAGMGISFGQILISAAFAFLLGAALPVMAFSFRALRARKKMEEQFPVALDVFVRGLRAGHPIASSLELLTVELPDPMGSQIGLVVDEVSYGAELRDALESMADRWDLDDMRMFVVALSVQRETGGNLAEILENLSSVIRERQSLMMKVRALSSEGRMTAVMLTVLPVFTFVLLFIINPRFFLDVADDPYFTPGFLSLIALYLIGYIAIRRMVDLKV